MSLRLEDVEREFDVADRLVDLARCALENGGLLGRDSDGRSESDGEWGEKG